MKCVIICALQRRLKEEPGARVLIHCKAGRGRAATIALCYLVASKYGNDIGQIKQQQQASKRDVDKVVTDTMHFLQDKRPVCEPVVLNYAPVQKFTTACVTGEGGLAKST
jgi:hypothetical protein